MKKIWNILVLIVISLLLAGNSWAAIHVNSTNPIQVYFKNNTSRTAVQFGIDLDNVTHETDIYGYCIDLDHTITSGTYEYTILPWQENEKYLGAAWLMDNYSPAQSTASIVGLQAAIWATIYNDYARFTPAITGYNAAYSSYLESLAGIDLSLVASSLMSSYLLIQPYDSTGLRQALIINNPNPVPIPGAALLLGSGLIGLIGFRNRKR